MRTLLLGCALGLVIPLLQVNAVAQDAKGRPSGPLTLRGTVESVRVTKHTPSSAYIGIKLKMELVNTGVKPIIFLRREPIFPGVALAERPESFGTNNVLAKSYVGPANDTSAEWAALRSSLNRPRPPHDETRILMPGESWPLAASVGITVPAEPGRAGISHNGAESLEVLRRLSPVWLQVACEVWPWNVEPPAPGAEREKLKFGRALRKRWGVVGLLWLDTVSSEPILLDLRSGN